MKPELINSDHNENCVDKHVVSSFAAVYEADTHHEEKKRSATAGDENPGARKKSKASEFQLPKLVVNMKKDQNYAKIIKNFFQKLDDKGYEDGISGMGNQILQSLKQKFILVDDNDCSIDDEDAMKKVEQCLRNHYYRSRRSFEHQSQRSEIINPSAEDIVLDMRFSKTYKDIMNNFFNDYVHQKYNNLPETGEAIRRELERNLGTEGMFLKRDGNGFVEVDREAVLQHIIQKLSNKPLPPRRIGIKSQETMGKQKSQFREDRPNVQTPTKTMSEQDRLELLDYFGRSIIVDFLKKNETAYGWRFIVKLRLLSEVWIAVKEGYTMITSKEDETKLTGVRKIATWAFREGYFDEYANSDFGKNLLERNNLSAQSYKIIFGHQTGGRTVNNQEITRRTISPNSSPAESLSEGPNNTENQIVTFDLTGEDRREYYLVYKDVTGKLDDYDDSSSKNFYGMLKICLETKLANTQQWNEKKDELAKRIKEFEEWKASDTSFVRDTVLPALFNEAKARLLDA